MRLEGSCHCKSVRFRVESPERFHIMLDYAAPRVEIPEGANEKHFPRYPDESLEDWHRRHGLLDG